MSLFSTKYLKSDLLSGSVVFLVALPLCLGIALASGAPLFAGIIAGIVGGIVVGSLSNSQLSVSGPAAGLTAIILTAIATLGSFEAFLLAGIIAGGIQLLLGFAKAGIISNYLPSNVIEGMLAAIGIIIILSQIPHAVGYNSIHENQFFNIGSSGDIPVIGSIVQSINFMHPGALVVVLASLAVIILFQKNKTLQKIKAIPGALVAVLTGVLINEGFRITGSSLYISERFLVSLPVPSSFSEFLGQFAVPDFTAISNPQVWIVALTLAAVASIETLLCIEAADKMDPLKRYTNTNTELKAQGIGNMVSCFIGGLPVTSVIVRTSANVNSGGRTKLAAISHGFFLLIAVVSIPHLLNKIPLASLAAILFSIGFKLASPKVFVHMWNNSKKFQFIPFVVTVVAIIATDLLVGVGVGLAVSIFFILKGNLKLAYFFKRDEFKEGETIHMELAQEVSFLNKAAIKQTFAHLPKSSKLVIDASNTIYIDHDVLMLIKNFYNFGSKDMGIEVDLVGFRKEYKMENTRHYVTSVVDPNASIVSPVEVEKGQRVPNHILSMKSFTMAEN
ncbi:SulP family inorganic anion transporter [Membranihabitans marinus]|uniref:SulP family inorganic anion transporter n=1 Tax=Membranihabitans marinus TaxID=1227546 RepID=UPI001F00C910|nr:SulP family inorganic anion transporter [Membranihabitans marinus]